MYFHVVISSECNSQCRYCYYKIYEDFGNDLNKRFDFDYTISPVIQYSVKDLKQFLSKGENTSITF